VKLGVKAPYVQRLEYDEFGQRAFLLVGNGAETAYSYNPLNRRLSRLTAGDFQDLNYTYDLVGNITALSNKVPVPAASDMGGPVDQTFAYDGLYRLTQATGAWRFSPNKRSDYSLSLAYDTIHNITRKTQSNAITTPGGATVPQKKTTYDFPYAYTGRGPHAPTVIGERAYSYDGNGNQTGWDDLTSGQRRTIVWDEENRIHEIRDNGRTTAFVYNDSGERVIKRGAQGETAYINQFWTVRNRSVATKHVFVGDTRIASKVVPGDAHLDPGSTDPFTGVLGQWWQHRSEQGWQNGQNTVKNPHYASNVMPDLLPEDNFVYFYHPDHLGSTSFATAATGDLYEHLEYFPFGETWVSEQTNTQRLPFLFTSKELDEETQLYYFGARYYDPRTSVWQSTDPILGSYLAGRPSGGVYAPVNLALYSYTWNNPARLIDPNGRQVEAPCEGCTPIPGSNDTAWYRPGNGNGSLGMIYYTGWSTGYSPYSSDQSTGTTWARDFFATAAHTAGRLSNEDTAVAKFIDENGLRGVPIIGHSNGAWSAILLHNAGYAGDVTAVAVPGQALVQLADSGKGGPWLTAYLGKLDPVVYTNFGVVTGALRGVRDGGRFGVGGAVAGGVGGAFVGGVTKTIGAARDLYQQGAWVNWVDTGIFGHTLNAYRGAGAPW